jgi:hypothetical protein
MTFGNQGYGSFDSNLQIFWPKSQSKVFLGKEAPGKIRENLWLRLLGEEVREEARERGPRIGNATARQIPMKLED